MGATGQDPTIMGHYHEVTWTGEAIQRFWEYFTLNQAAHAHHFSKIFGEAIVRVARKYAGLKGLVVDLGCGPGYLIPYLLNLGLSIKALDSSPHSVQLVQEHFGRHAGFQGAQVGDLCALPLCDEEADFIFLIEVLEHLKPEETPRALAEIFRILKPGGCLFLTVPHQEDLDSQKIACPECGCVFHRVQHQQSFRVEHLTEMLVGQGFQPLRVTALNFRDYAGSGLKRLEGWLRRTLAGFRRRPRWQPHLVAIARRP